VPDGEHGRIVITDLNNYSMPLIRFDIGDTGSMLSEKCPCGRSLPTLSQVTGRTFSHFVKRNGEVIHAQYFVALLFFRHWVREFKIIQKDYDRIVIKATTAGEPLQKDIEEIEAGVCRAMGQNCRVEWDFVPEIAPSPSGKYLYTVCEVG